MTGQRESGDRRAGSLVVLAVLLGAGAAWFFLLQRKSGLGETPPLRLAAPVVSGAVEPEPEEPEESEEPDDSRLYAESGMTLDEFIKVLEKEAPKPVAAAVVEAFQREPELRDTYGTFVKERGKSASAAEFVRAVRPLAEFRKLLARFKGDSGFSGALAKIQRNPGAAKVLRASLSGPPSPATAPAARTAIDGRGQRIGQGATARTGVSYAAQPQAAGERAGLGEQGSHAYQAGQAGKPGAAGQGAHGVTPLDKQWKDVSVVDKSADGKKIEALLKMYPCLQTLGEATVRQFIKGQQRAGLHQGMPRSRSVQSRRGLCGGERSSLPGAGQAEPAQIRARRVRDGRRDLPGRRHDGPRGQGHLLRETRVGYVREAGFHRPPMPRGEAVLLLLLRIHVAESCGTWNDLRRLRAYSGRPIRPVAPLSGASSTRAARAEVNRG